MAITIDPKTGAVNVGYKAPTPTPTTASTLTVASSPSSSTASSKTATTATAPKTGTTAASTSTSTVAGAMTPEQIKQYYATEGQKANPLSPKDWLAQQSGGTKTGTTSAAPAATPNYTDIAKQISDIQAQMPALTKAVQANVAARTPTPPATEKKGTDISSSFAGGTPTTGTGAQGTATQGTAAQTPQQQVAAQFTTISNQMKDLYGASLQISQQARDNEIARIQAQHGIDVATVTQAYDKAENQINRTVGLLGGSFGIPKSKVQAILDNQNDVFLSMTNSMAQLNLNETTALNNADLTAAQQANQAGKDLLQFTSDMFSKQLTFVQTQQQNAQGLLSTAVSSGSLGQATDAQLMDLANATGYDVLDLKNLRDQAKTTSGIQMEQALADLQYKKAQTEYETSGVTQKQAQAQMEALEAEKYYYQGLTEQAKLAGSQGVVDYSTVARRLAAQGIPTATSTTEGKLQQNYINKLNDVGIGPQSAQSIWNMIITGWTLNEIRDEIRNSGNDPAALDKFMEVLQKNETGAFG